MILTIDKSKELTRKEYVDFLQKTKGETISESRISQMVSAGKLKVRDYPELNNLQLIVLDDDEQALAQSRFSTSQPIHTYSYKELGLFLGTLVRDLTNENGNAQTLLNEKQAQLDQLVTTLQQTETDRDEARQTVQKMASYQQQVEADNESLQTTLAQRTDQVKTLEAELRNLNESLTNTQRKLDVETSFRSEFDSFKTMVMDLLQKQADAAIATAELPKPATGKRAKAAKS